MKRSPLKFTILVFVLSVPFWVLGALAAQWAEQLPVALPVSALMFICPMIAALILVRLEEGPGSVGPFLRRAFDYRRIAPRIWYLPILLLMPAMMLASYGLMVWSGRPLPAEPMIPWADLPVFFLVFFVGAIGEELGWTAYATDAMQARWSALATGLGLGLIWAFWHAIPFYQARPDPGWVFWQGASTVALRVIMVWLYNNSGRSVFGAVLFHMMINVSNFAFPNYGSHYDPAVVFFVQASVALLVVVLWGAPTLADFYFAPRPDVARR